MKVNRSLVIYVGIIVISLSIIGYTLYYFYDQMGGFDELEVIELNPIERKIVGITYQGKAQTATYEKAVAKCVDQISNKKLNGVLTIITYKSDTLESNEVSLFIGISLNSSMAEIPYDFEVRQLSSKNRYGMFLSMHPAVRPAIDRVEEMLSSQAKTDGKELLPMFMELYYPDDSMTIEAWTK